MPASTLLIIVVCICFLSSYPADAWSKISPSSGVQLSGYARHSLSPFLSRKQTTHIRMSMSDEVEFQQLIDKEDYEAAFRVLKRNPMLQIKQKNACKLLNNLDRLEDVTNAEDPQQKVSSQLLSTSPHEVLVICLITWF